MHLTEQATHPIQPEYCTIPLTQGKFALVDASDYAALSAFKWTAQWNPSTQSFYAFRHSTGGRNNRKRIPMEKAILGRAGTVDHKTRNTLDNRRQNLRPATHGQNTVNSKMRADNTSGFKGVVFLKNAGVWRAQITVRGKTTYLGQFSSAALAHAAYQSAAVDIHGEFFNP